MLLLRYEVRFKGQDRTALDKWLLLEASDRSCGFFIFSRWAPFPTSTRILRGFEVFKK